MSKSISLEVESESDSGNTNDVVPYQVPHPSLTISTSVIKSKVNRPDPRVYNPPTRLEEGGRWWPPIDRYKQGGGDRENYHCSDMTPVLQSPVDHEKLRCDSR